MARIHERKAAKDYPGTDIKKGDTYYYVQIKTGPRSSRTIRSKIRPKRWQLTGSEFYSTLWQIEDERFDGVAEASDLKDIAEELRTLGEEQQEKFDNMPDGLQQGDTGQLLEARAENCGTWADEIETVADQLEEELTTFDDGLEPWREYHRAMKEWEDADEEERGPEPDEPTEAAHDSFQSIDLEDEDAVREARQEIINDKVQEAQDANPGID
jgi:hypothetical protein